MDRIWNLPSMSAILLILMPVPPPSPGLILRPLRRRRLAGRQAPLLQAGARVAFRRTAVPACHPRRLHAGPAGTRRRTARPMLAVFEDRRVGGMDQAGHAVWLAAVRRRVPAGPAC